MILMLFKKLWKSDDIGEKLKKKETKKKRLKPIFLYPLKPEKALSLFMQVDPEKIRVMKRKVALSSA